MMALNIDLNFAKTIIIPLNYKCANNHDEYVYICVSKRLLILFHFFSTFNTVNIN